MYTYTVTLHFRDRHGVASLCFYVWTLRYGFHACAEVILAIRFHRRKMSTHALEKMTRDRFRVMSLALTRKCPRNVVQMKEAMAALFGNDSVAISCHCKRSKIILVKVL